MSAQSVKINKVFPMPLLEDRNLKVLMPECGVLGIANFYEEIGDYERAIKEIR